MTEQEFYQKVDGECHEDLIVFIRQKYKSEKEWEYTNQLCLAEGIGFVWQVDWNEGQEDVEILGYIPVSEVEPVKHAYWKSFVGSAYHGLDEYDEPIFRKVLVHHCSRCNRKTVIKEKYCPNCGAKMDLEEENGKIAGK